MTKDIIIIADYSQEAPLSLEELCDICQVSLDVVHDLIEYDIIHPQGTVPEEWVFSLRELKRLKTAMRLQRDLEINVAGIALVLDLLDQLEAMQQKMTLLERHF